MPFEVYDVAFRDNARILQIIAIRRRYRWSSFSVSAPRSSNTGTNNLPPLTFHHVHGDNIRLCNGGTIARRHESFCKGVTFSARPVRVGEKVRSLDRRRRLLINHTSTGRRPCRLWETGDSRYARETAIRIPRNIKTDRCLRP